MANDLNTVSIIGNLTKDPDVKEVGNGTTVCELRIANNSSFKKGDEWQEKANYFQVVVWGAQATNCGKYLSKGSKAGISGRLEWQSWDKAEGEGVNSRVVIVANNVQFLSTPKKVDENPAPVGDDDDIPFD